MNLKRLVNFYDGILSNRNVCCFVFTLISLVVALLFHPTYQTMDDLDMRLVLDGSSEYKHNTPSEFSLYMSVIYGKILKFLYTYVPSFYWYDFFLYFFSFISVFVMMLFIFPNFYKERHFLKIIKLIIISCLSYIVFLLPQFTLTSGFLSISGILALFMVISDSEYALIRKDKIFLTIYFFISLLFSSLIRFDNCMIVSFYTGLCLLPFIIFHKKSIFKFILYGLMALFIVLIFFCQNNKIIKSNVEYNNILRMNLARAEIQDKMGAWDHFYAPWIGLEDNLDKIKNKNFEFSKGDYRMLLSTFFIGSKKILNAENLEKVANKLKKYKKNKKELFRYSDGKNVLFLYLFMFILSCIFSYKYSKFPFWAILLFFCFWCFINYFYKTIPMRLYYSFGIASIISIIYLVTKIKTNKIYYIYFMSILLCALCVSYEFYRYNYYNLNNYRHNKITLKKEKNDKLYFFDGITSTFLGRPFHSTLLQKYHLDFLFDSPLNAHHNYRKLLKKYNISEDNPWLDICKKKNFVIWDSSKMHNGQFEAYINGLKYFMYEKYKKSILFINKSYIFQCRILTDKELWLKKKYKEEVRDIFETKHGVYLYANKHGKNIKEKIDIINYLNSIRYSDWHILKIEFAHKYLGNKATGEEIEEFLNLMEAENIMESKKED